MTYRIFIHTERTGNLVFKGVKDFSEEGSFIRFKDELTGKIRLFPIINCQIEVESSIKGENGDGSG